MHRWISKRRDRFKKVWLRLLYGTGTPADLERASERASQNRQEIEASETCGCFNCLEIFHPTDIKRWLADGTALCPRCGGWIDAVIGSASGFPITRRFLAQMHIKWF